jgi:hypothetical protein
MRPGKLLVAVMSLVSAGALSGCVAVGYSSRGGWFMFPGFGVLLVILIVFLLLRRR